MGLDQWQSEDFLKIAFHVHVKQIAFIMLISLLSLIAAIIILSLIFKFFPSIRSKRGYQEIGSGWLSLGLENTSHGPNINSADPQINNIKNASKEKQSQKQKKNKKSEKQKQTTQTSSQKQTNVFESASGEAIGKQIQNYDTLENGSFTSQHFILPFTSLPNEILAKLAKRRYNN
ncbi:MAG: hypothetical protein EZS28_051768 [Streblomastix strix]|uniref:Uncharacterized protein n=1 Tax=Streblomastix strix TaxID=222440 RepID=A0A5J4T5P2_9EUKA|nr:MAG: hypothetical protein EZS28_051768 [Streblomastix strix]